MTGIRLGLIGDNIAASHSPRLHQAAGALCGLDVSYELLIPSEHGMDFDQLLAACHDGGFRGVNVTYPYKVRAFDKALPQANTVQRIGACNTLLFADPLIGHNTDYTGFQRAFRQAFGCRRPGRVAIAGAGGVGKAIAFALADLGASSLAIFDGDQDKAVRLTTAVRADAPGTPTRAAVSIADAVDGADGFVNATPLGMHGHPGTAIDAHLLPANGWAFDAVYTPVHTEFFEAALRAGLDVMSGYELFLHQGIDAFRIFTGHQPDVDEVRRALMAPTEGLASIA